MPIYNNDPQKLNLYNFKILNIITIYTITCFQQYKIRALLFRKINHHNVKIKTVNIVIIAIVVCSF